MNRIGVSLRGMSCRNTVWRWPVRALLLAAWGLLSLTMTPSAAHAAETQLLTVAPRGSATQSAYIDATGVTQPDWVVLLFAGGDGAIALGEAGPRHMQNNFVIHTAAYWPRNGMVAVDVDAPSDNANGMDDVFRLGDAHAQDITALVDALRQRFPSAKIALVGTSRGTISVGGLLRHNPALADAYVLTSPVTVAGRGGPGLSGTSWPKSAARVLVVSNRNDGCAVSPFWAAQKMAEANDFKLLTFASDAGDTSMPGACGPHAPHGYLGIEPAVLDAIIAWLRGTGGPATQ